MSNRNPQNNPDQLRVKDLFLLGCAAACAIGVIAKNQFGFVLGMVGAGGVAATVLFIRDDQVISAAPRAVSVPKPKPTPQAQQTQPTQAAQPQGAQGGIDFNTYQAPAPSANEYNVNGQTFKF